ncbi:MAG: hypothetical protein KAI18_00335 [Candidatus Aenigmarchaeota archaeon]|nr:hypothetical protein [Candidatus Aenigmarchaeota archaeon]
MFECDGGAVDSGTVRKDNFQESVLANAIAHKKMIDQQESSGKKDAIEEPDTPETFISDIYDIFTSITYNKYIEKIYSDKLDYPSIKKDFVDISMGEFKALVSKNIYDSIKKTGDIKPMSELVETFSLARMLNLAINGDKRVCEHITPKDLKSDFGGRKDDKDLDLCACAIYSKMSDGKNIDIICYTNNSSRPNTMEDMIGVIKIKDAKGSKNNLYKMCPHTKDLDRDECEQLRPKLCELFDMDVCLKEDSYEPIDDYLQRKYDVVIGQVKGDADYLDKQIKIISGLIYGKYITNIVINSEGHFSLKKEEPEIPGYM